MIACRDVGREAAATRGSGGARRKCHGGARVLLATVLLAVAALCALQAAAPAESMPPVIRFIIPFAPGGPVDFTARVMAEGMQKDLGITIVPDNRAGANGFVGAVAVKESPPDGRTFLFTSSGMMTISPHLEKNLGYDPLNDFVHISMVAYADVVLVVGPKVQARTMAEFIKEARESKEPLTMGSAGYGNITHGQIELFKEAAKIELLHVPYKGGAPALTDVLGGQIAGTFVGLNVALPHIRAGTLRALGIVGDKRSASAPEIPTFVELGYASVDPLTWMGLMGPKGTPEFVTKTMAASVQRVVQQPATLARFAENGVVPWVLSSEEFRERIRLENERWGQFIATHNMRGE